MSVTNDLSIYYYQGVKASPSHSYLHPSIKKKMERLVQKERKIE